MGLPPSRAQPREGVPAGRRGREGHGPTRRARIPLYPSPQPFHRTMGRRALASLDGRVARPRPGADGLCSNNGRACPVDGKRAQKPPPTDAKALQSVCPDLLAAFGPTSPARLGGLFVFLSLQPIATRAPAAAPRRHLRLWVRGNFHSAVSSPSPPCLLFSSTSTGGSRTRVSSEGAASVIGFGTTAPSTPVLQTFHPTTCHPCHAEHHRRLGHPAFEVRGGAEMITSGSPRLASGPHSSQVEIDKQKRLIFGKTQALGLLSFSPRILRLIVSRPSLTVSTLFCPGIWLLPSMITATVGAGAGAPRAQRNTAGVEGACQACGGNSVSFTTLSFTTLSSSFDDYPPRSRPVRLRLSTAHPRALAGKGEVTRPLQSPQHQPSSQGSVST